ncbi:MAG TPA: hypothetical protein DD979_03115 [Gammaproteobacteria bacterium]|jgi:putative Ca2+/H+ antiporter (TMEM165/GDT1 family)|nr:hypothetical protein [Gammaproteobacteria bacterium]
MRDLFMVLAALFLAELGDKTQVATVLFTSSQVMNPVWVFLAVSVTLVAASAIAVTLGHAASQYLAVLPLKLLAGVGFILLGVWAVLEHFGIVS